MFFHSISLETRLKDFYGLIELLQHVTVNFPWREVDEQVFQTFSHWVMTTTGTLGRNKALIDDYKLYLLVVHVITWRHVSLF